MLTLYKIRSLFSLVNLFALLSGALLTASFAPFNLYWLAFLCPALFLFSISERTPQQAALQGGLFGIGFFGTGVSWVFVSIHVYGPSPVLLAATLTALFVIVLSIFPCLMAGVFKKLFPAPSAIAYLIAFPALWVIFEILRSFIFTGFPWLLLGYSQTNSPIASLLPIIGTYGTSFVLIMLAGSIAYSVKKHTKPFSFLLPVATLGLILSAGLFSTTISWTTPKGNALHASLIQGNIPQNEKWDPHFIRKIILRYQDLTDQEWKSDIVVWPEAAVPIPLPYSREWIASLTQQAQEHNTLLIVGALNEDSKSAYHNSVLALGEESQLYEKKKLVPFGEYVPFESWLRGLISFFDLPMSNLSPGNSDTANMLQVNSLSILPLICYEIAYVDMIKKANESDFIVTISNDGWFGNSIGPHQHLQIAQARALETGRYVLRATNSGITAIITPKGKVSAQIPQFQTAVLRGELFSMTGKTPFLYIDYRFFLALMAFMLMISFVLSFKNRDK